MRLSETAGYNYVYVYIGRKEIEKKPGFISTPTWYKCLPSLSHVPYRTACPTAYYQTWLLIISSHFRQNDACKVSAARIGRGAESEGSGFQLTYMLIPIASFLYNREWGTI